MTEALRLADQCTKEETAENYGRLGELIGQLESSTGQYLRSQTGYQFLITKLEQGSPLNPDDLKTLRKLIVGDADEYLKYDDDFEQAKSELRRILEEIRKLKSTEMDPGKLMRLRVLCREASSALVPTMHYLEQKQRVKNFEEHMRDPLSDTTRHLLAGIITRMAS
jgi:hypothetical protein